jgi:hypothetical protein
MHRAPYALAASPAEKNYTVSDGFYDFFGPISDCRFVLLTRARCRERAAKYGTIKGGDHARSGDFD